MYPWISRTLDFLLQFCEKKCGLYMDVYGMQGKGGCSLIVKIAIIAACFFWRKSCDDLQAILPCLQDVISI